MNNIIFVSFYTTAPEDYSPAAEELVKSLDRFTLPHDVREVDDKGGWQGAVRYKPQFILEMLEDHDDVDAVVWVDADAIIEAKPKLLYEIESDMAVYIHKTPNGKEELLSGTMFWRNNDASKKALKEWIAAMPSVPDDWTKPEQMKLQEMLGSLACTWESFPKPYCYISPNPVTRRRDGGPIIRHRQWSRRHRYAGEKQPVPRRRREPRPKPRAQRMSRPRSEKVTERPKVGRDVVAMAAKERRDRVYARRSQMAVATGAEERAVGAQASAIPKPPSPRPPRPSRAQRLRRRDAKLTGPGRPKGAPTLAYPAAGGVVGRDERPDEIARAVKAMKAQHSAKELDGTLKEHGTVVIMGNSWSLDLLDLEPLRAIPTIGCNRAFLHKTFWPNYLMIADRQPYCQQRDQWLLKQAADKGVKILVSDSVFDPRETLRGPYTVEYRRAQPPPTDFPVYIYKFGPRGKKWTYDGVAKGEVDLPVNLTSFGKSLVTCQNIFGSMIQAAAILGAKRIGIIGVEWKWPLDKPSHFFGDGKAVGAYQQEGTVHSTVAACKQVAAKMRKAGIEVRNLSPVKKCPFAHVWPSSSYEDFIAATPAPEVACD